MNNNVISDQSTALIAAVSELASAVRMLANSHANHAAAVQRAAIVGSVARRNPPAPAQAHNPGKWSYGARVAAVVADVEDGLVWSDKRKRDADQQPTDAAPTDKGSDSTAANSNKENHRDSF